MLEIISIVMGLLNKVVPDADARAKAQEALTQGLIENESAIVQAMSSVMAADAASESWLTRATRPIVVLWGLTMVSFVGVVAPAIGIQTEVVDGLAGIPSELWTIVTVGVGIISAGGPSRRRSGPSEMDSLLHDTRDRVVELGVRFEHLEEVVTKNSKILQELHELQLQAKGASRFVRLAWDGGKLLFAGATGAGLWTWAQAHLPRLALIASLLMFPVKPARAWTGWVLETELCLASACRLVTRVNLGNATLCEQAVAELLESVPKGSGVTVRARCVEGAPAA